MYEKFNFILNNKTKKEALKHNLVELARSTCPVDTGNMKYSAIYCEDMPFGFRIVWDLEKATYMEYVDKGTQPLTPKKIHNIGFVNRGVSMCLAYSEFYNRERGNVPTNLSEKIKKTKNSYYVFGARHGIGEYSIKQDYTKGRSSYLDTYTPLRDKEIMKKVGYSKNEYLKSVLDNAKTRLDDYIVPTLSSDEMFEIEEQRYNFFMDPKIKRMLLKGIGELKKQNKQDAEIEKIEKKINDL